MSISKLNGNRPSVSFTQDLASGLVLKPHQLEAALDPATPMRLLAGKFERDTSERPIRTPLKGAQMARYINDSLAPQPHGGQLAQGRAAGRSGGMT